MMAEHEQYLNLWNKLTTSIEANLEFAKLVIKQEPSNTKYFFGEYSYEIIKWIAITIYYKKASELDSFICEKYGEYFEFVTKPFDKDNKPQWYQLNAYKGINGMKLKSWLMRNSHQYFARKKKIDEKRAFHESEMIDFIDYEALLSLEDSQQNLSEEQCVHREYLSKAWATLSDKDKRILHCLVMDKKNWREAYDLLNEYINPRLGRQIMTTWSDKRKQDALAMLKAQALTHLINRLNQVK